VLPIVCIKYECVPWLRVIHNAISALSKSTRQLWTVLMISMVQYWFPECHHGLFSFHVIQFSTILLWNKLHIIWIFCFFNKVIWCYPKRRFHFWRCQMWTIKQFSEGCVCAWMGIYFLINVRLIIYFNTD